MIAAETVRVTVVFTEQLQSVSESACVCWNFYMQNDGVLSLRNCTRAEIWFADMK